MEGLDFREWLKNSDSSDIDPDEIGISLPKKYASKKKAGPRPSVPTHSPSPPPGDPIMPPVGGVYELREELRKLVKLRTKYNAQPKDAMMDAELEVLAAELAGLGIGELPEELLGGERLGNPRHRGVGDIDEIGISMPDEYRSRLHDSKGAGLRANGSSGEEQDEGVASATAKTWYSIPEQQGKATPTSAEDIVGEEIWKRGGRCQ